MKKIGQETSDIAATNKKGQKKNINNSTTSTIIITQQVKRKQTKITLTSKKTNLFFAWQAFLYFDAVSSTADLEFLSVVASLQTTKSVNNNITQFIMF